MRIRKQPIALALVAALIGAPAFAQSAVSRINGDVSVTGTTLNDNTLADPNVYATTPEARGDKQLLSDIVGAIAGDSRMSGAQIDVQVSEGRVTLGGVARDIAQVQQARSIADSIAGAANVTSRVTTGG